MNETTLPSKESKSAIGVDDRGKMNYASAAAEGFIEIMVPSLPGSPRETETMHMRNFGQHTISKIESALARQPYMTEGATQNPVQVMRHYTAVARGASLLDKATLGRMEKLTAEFENAPKREEFYRSTVKPFLGGLAPQRR
jgi:hypothetical protein